MNLQEYTPLALRTAKIMESKLDMLVHGAMGCMTEAGELAATAQRYIAIGGMDEENAVEELGDSAWFAVYTAFSLGLSLHDIMAHVEVVKPVDARRPQDPVSATSFGFATLALNAAAERIGTPVKAHKFYGKPLDQLAVSRALGEYIGGLRTLCAYLGVSFGTVLSTNVAKLSKRYPEKYSDTAAIERADKVEAFPFPTSASHGG